MVAGAADLDALDLKLIDLLRINARSSITTLGHATGASRARIYDRLRRLERLQIIQGYTVRLGDGYLHTLIRAHVMLKFNPQRRGEIERTLAGFAHICELHAISGEYDLIAVTEARSVHELNRHIDEIGSLDGIEKTTSSVLLDTKKLR